MRLNITIDSATTAEMRALAAAKSVTLREESPRLGFEYERDKVGLVNVHCDGPEMWSASTGPMPSGTDTALLANYQDQLRVRRQRVT